MGKTNNPIILGGSDPFTHMLCVGPTRCGKTSTILLPMIYQLLVQKKRGKALGLSVIEPKGDLAWEVKEFCDVMDIPYVYLDPDSLETDFFNVMEGDEDGVVEATVAVLQSMFGKQEAFFATVQELSTRNVTRLLKQLKGDDLTLLDVLATLRDENLLKQHLEDLREKVGNTDLISFFDNELLGALADQYRKLVVGLRAQLENMTSNTKLRRIIGQKSSINLDRHLNEGGVLIVNTALGTLKKAGDAFGMFVNIHLQSATFRRPGTEKTRIPHYMIIDEYSRYINPDVEMFLSVAASYRVAGVFATQSLGQLEIESGKIGPKAMKQAIMTSCRNKITFCGLSAADAKEFADEFGKDLVTMRQSTYKNRILLPKWFPESYRDTETEEYRFRPTYLQDQMKRFHFVCRILNDGTPQNPIEGVGTFVPRNWRELREWDVKRESMQPQSSFKKGFSIVKKRVENKRNIPSPNEVSLLVIDPQNHGERTYVEENAVLMGRGETIEHHQEEKNSKIEFEEIEINQDKQMKEAVKKDESPFEQRPPMQAEQPKVKQKENVISPTVLDDNEDDFF